MTSSCHFQIPNALKIFRPSQKKISHFLIFQYGRFSYKINQTLLIFNRPLTNIILRGRKIRTHSVRFYLLSSHSVRGEVASDGRQRAILFHALHAPRRSGVGAAERREHGAHWIPTRKVVIRKVKSNMKS